MCTVQPQNKYNVKIIHLITIYLFSYLNEDINENVKININLLFDLATFMPSLTSNFLKIYYIKHIQKGIKYKKNTYDPPPDYEITNTIEVPCTSFFSSTSLLSLRISHCSGHFIWCIHAFLHTFCTMYVSLNNSYHFTTCFVNWLYVWIHTCWHVWYIIHVVETVLTKYILCASLCFLAFGLESLDCEWKGSVSQVGIRQWKAISPSFPSSVSS